MTVMSFLKGKSSVRELMDMPQKIFQTLYFYAYKESIAREKTAIEAEKSGKKDTMDDPNVAASLGEMMEDAM